MQLEIIRLRPLDSALGKQEKRYMYVRRMLLDVAARGAK